MTKTTKLIALCLPGDNASSNVRLKAHIAAKVAEHNKRTTFGFIILFDVICMTHIIMGFVVRAFRLTQLIPRCYSLNFALRFPPRYNRLVKLLRTVIEKDFLNGGYIQAAGWCAEHAEWAEHVDLVLEMTVMRSCYTKGRNIKLEPARNEDLLTSICEALNKC